MASSGDLAVCLWVEIVVMRVAAGVVLRMNQMEKRLMSRALRKVWTKPALIEPEAVDP
jgi:hypothetical protein